MEEKRVRYVPVEEEEIIAKRYVPVEEEVIPRRYVPVEEEEVIAKRYVPAEEEVIPRRYVPVEEEKVIPRRYVPVEEQELGAKQYVSLGEEITKDDHCGTRLGFSDEKQDKVKAAIKEVPQGLSQKELQGAEINVGKEHQQSEKKIKKEQPKSSGMQKPVEKIKKEQPKSSGTQKPVEKIKKEQPKSSETQKPVEKIKKEQPKSSGTQKLQTKIKKNQLKSNERQQTEKKTKNNQSKSNKMPHSQAKVNKHQSNCNGNQQVQLKRVSQYEKSNIKKSGKIENPSKQVHSVKQNQKPKQIEQVELDSKSKLNKYLLLFGILLIIILWMAHSKKAEVIDDINTIETQVLGQSIGLEEEQVEEAVEITGDVNKQQRQVEDELKELTENYLDHFVEAVNKGNPDIVFPYLTYDGPLYNDHTKYIPYFYNKGIKEEVVTYEIQGIREINESKYEVEVLETLYITSNNKTRLREFKSIYKVLKVREHFLFHELQQEEILN